MIMKHIKGVKTVEDSKEKIPPLPPKATKAATPVLLNMMPQKRIQVNMAVTNALLIGEDTEDNLIAKIQRVLIAGAQERMIWIAQIVDYVVLMAVLIAVLMNRKKKIYRATESTMEIVSYHINPNQRMRAPKTYQTTTCNLLRMIKHPLLLMAHPVHLQQYRIITALATATLMDLY